MDPDSVSERRPIDVPLLAGMAIAGALIGVLSALGALPGQGELIAWIVLSTAALIAALRRIPSDLFRHLTFGGVLAGFLGADAKILLWSRFIANHPDLVDAVASDAGGEVPRTALIIADTATGALFGLAAGLVGLLILRRRPVATAPDNE